MCIRFGHCQHRQLRVGSQSSQHSQIVSNALLIRRMRVWAISTLSTFAVVIELARDSVSGVVAVARVGDGIELYGVFFVVRIRKVDELLGRGFRERMLLFCDSDSLVQLIQIDLRQLMGWVVCDDDFEICKLIEDRNR